MQDDDVLIKEILVSDKDLNGSRQINGELESTIHALRYVLEHLNEIDDKKITIFYDYEASRNGRPENGPLVKMSQLTTKSVFNVI